MIVVAEYNQSDQLPPLAGVWERLFERTPDACFSQNLNWINSCPISQTEKPRILLGVVSGRPFGAWPMKVVTRHTSSGPLRVLTDFGEPWFPAAGPVGPNTTAMLTAGFRHLQRTKKDWDVIELRKDVTTTQQSDRLENAFRLMGWTFEKQADPRWLEICPETVLPEEFSAKFPMRSSTQSGRFRLDRHRAGESPTPAWSLLAASLSLVESQWGVEEAQVQRSLHQASFRAELSDWCLLLQDDVPQAAALFLSKPNGMHCTVLAGVSESARLELLLRILQDGFWRGDGPYRFRADQVPFLSFWTNATPRGFRYTYIRPWALRARWQRFCERRPGLQTTVATDDPEQPIASPPRLMLYAPPHFESPSTWSSTQP